MKLRGWTLGATCLAIVACGGSREETVRPVAPTRGAPSAETTAPVAAQLYTASLRRAGTEPSTWVLQVAEACAAGASCPVRGAPVFARHYVCAAPRKCDRTTALDRVGVTDDAGRVPVDPHDGNGRQLARVEIFVARDRGDAATIAPWLRDDHLMVDETSPGLARVADLRVEDAPPKSLNLSVEGLATEDSMWQSALATCSKPVDESSCDQIREYQKAYPEGRHAGEVFGVLFEATRDLQRQSGEKMQAGWKQQADEARARQEAQRRQWEHERRESASRNACLSACYGNPSNDRPTCDTKCR